MINSSCSEVAQINLFKNSELSKKEREIQSKRYSKIGTPIIASPHGQLLIKKIGITKEDMSADILGWAVAHFALDKCFNRIDWAQAGDEEVRKELTELGVKDLEKWRFMECTDKNAGSRTGAQGRISFPPPPFDLPADLAPVTNEYGKPKLDSKGLIEIPATKFSKFLAGLGHPWTSTSVHHKPRRKNKVS